MNAQAIILSIPLQAYCIIQILGIFTINGNHSQLPQIKPSGPVCFRNLSTAALRLVHHLLRKTFRKIKASYNGHNIHAGIIDMAKYFNHFSLRAFPAASAIISDFHNDF